MIRSPEGNMLAPREQFQATLQYFTDAFSVDNLFRFRSSASAPAITTSELEQAIGTLKSRKAVPVGSAPPEVWKACPDVFAASLAATYAQGTASSPSCLSSEITDCHLMLLLKPHKVSRQPKDLRPTGVQDPASKLIARVLRDRLSPQVTQLLHASPQYAYTQDPGQIHR